MLHSHFHSCFQCMWHTLSHLRGCIWNRIGYLHGKCICALRSTTINILNIFFPHIPCLFFFCLRFSYFIYVSCYSVFTVFCLRLSFIVLLVLVFIIIAYIIQLSTRNIWKKFSVCPGCGNIVVHWPQKRKIKEYWQILSKTGRDYMLHLNQSGRVLCRFIKAKDEYIDNTHFDKMYFLDEHINNKLLSYAIR